MQQKVTIPADGRLNLELHVPKHIPVGNAVFSFSPANEEVSSLQGKLHNLTGCIADSKIFIGDAVALQKACRDEW